MASKDSIDDILNVDRYGDLQGSSLASDLLEPVVVSKPVQASRMVTTSAKSNCVTFCSKNKLSLPTFTRCSDTNGMQGYTTEAKWEGPIEEGTAPIVFMEKVCGPTKREAEGDAALKLQAKIGDWFDSHRIIEHIGNYKGDLQQFIVKNGHRLMAAKYSTEQSTQGQSSFSCTLSVEDKITGEYSTSGSGVGKRTAEKEAARKMLIKLANVIDSPPSKDPSTLKNEIAKLHSDIQTAFPDHKIEYLPLNNGNERVRYILNTCSLVLKKENTPTIVVATCSGLKLEDAKASCAKLAIQYFSELKELIN